MNIRFKPSDEIMDERGIAHTIRRIDYPYYQATDRNGTPVRLLIQETDWLCHKSDDTPIYLVMDKSVHSVMKVFNQKKNAEEYQRIFGGTIEKQYVI